MSKLPTNWREVLTLDESQVLYWTRCCGNYLILPTGDGKFQWEYHWHVMGTCDSLQSALLACREHLHSTEVSSQRFSDSDVSAEALQ